MCMNTHVAFSLTLNFITALRRSPGSQRALAASRPPRATPANSPVLQVLNPLSPAHSCRKPSKFSPGFPHFLPRLLQCPRLSSGLPLSPPWRTETCHKGPARPCPSEPTRTLTRAEPPGSPSPTPLPRPLGLPTRGFQILLGSAREASEFRPRSERLPPRSARDPAPASAPGPSPRPAPRPGPAPPPRSLLFTPAAPRGPRPAAPAPEPPPPTRARLASLPPRARAPRRYLGLGEEVRGPLHHGEVALADGAVDLVVADAGGRRPAGGRGRGTRRACCRRHSSGGGRGSRRRQRQQAARLPGPPRRGPRSPAGSARRRRRHLVH